MIREKRPYESEIDKDFLDLDNNSNDEVVSENGNEKYDDMFSDDFSDFFGSDYSGVPSMEKHGDLLKHLTRFDKYLKDKVNGWLGLVWDNEKQQYVRDNNIEPLMNKKGAAYYINFLNTYVRENNILTYIRKQDYNYMVEDIYRTIFRDLLVNMENFGIKNNSHLINLGIQLSHSAELILMGAGDGKYSEFLSSTTNRNENIVVPRGDDNTKVEVRRKGFLSTLKKALGGN